MSRAQLTSTVEQNSAGAAAPVVAGKNAVTNGAFDIAQRGTSFTPTGSAYTFDRWYYNGATSGMTLTQQSSGLANTRYNLRYQRNSGSAVTTATGIAQPIETAAAILLAGQTVTLSFYARAGANFSAASSFLGVQVFAGTGTDQNPYTGYTGQTIPINSGVNITTSWARYSFTTTLAGTITELTPNFYWTPVGTAGTNDYFEITGVQLELGSVATPFSRAGGTLQGELALCQRYYQSRSVMYKSTSSGGFSTNAYDSGIFPTQMRATPTLVFTSDTGTSGAANLYVSGSATASTAISITAAVDGFRGNFSNASWGTTANGAFLAYSYTANAEL